MSATLRRRIAWLERRRPEIEAEEVEEQARFEVDSLIAAWPLSATGEPLPLWQLREIFGEGFLADSRRRNRKRAARNA
jgi:hypothetical protein